MWIEYKVTGSSFFLYNINSFLVSRRLYFILMALNMEKCAQEIAINCISQYKSAPINPVSENKTVKCILNCVLV